MGRPRRGRHAQAGPREGGRRRRSSHRNSSARLTKLLVELEHRAVPGVGIDDELAVRESSIEVDGVLGGHHLGRRELPPTLGPAHANQRYAALRSSGRRPARLVGPAPGVSCSCACARSSRKPDKRHAHAPRAFARFGATAPRPPTAIVGGAEFRSWSGPLLAGSAPITVRRSWKVALYEALFVGVAIARDRRIPCPPTSH
jgi:hypothetical protein